MTRENRKGIPEYIRRGAIESFSHGVDSTDERKSGRLRGDSHLDVGGGVEGEERVVLVALRDGRERWMEVCEHPGRDPFEILRFLVLIFFAA